MKENKKGFFWFQLDWKGKYIRTKKLLGFLIVAIVVIWLREIPLLTKMLYTLVFTGVYFGQLAYCYNKMQQEREGQGT